MIATARSVYCWLPDIMQGAMITPTHLYLLSNVYRFFFLFTLYTRWRNEDEEEEEVDQKLRLREETFFIRLYSAEHSFR